KRKYCCSGGDSVLSCRAACRRSTSRHSIRAIRCGDPGKRHATTTRKRGQQMPATPQGRFEPVPLPSLAPGELTVARLVPVLREWVSSAPMRALAEAAGWAWAADADTGELIRQLAGLSADWDFRGRGGAMVERNFIDRQAALEGEREIPEDLVIPAASALGLVSATPIPPEKFTSLVVL